MRVVKRLLGFLSRPSARWSAGTLLGSGALLIALLFGGGYGFMQATNTLEFCISCHEMRDTVYQEYKESMHYANAAGVRATCADCHVPKQAWPMIKAKVSAVKDVWHTLLGTIDTPEKFEAHRWEMASRVWAMMEETDSSTCRSCHDFSFMDLSDQGRSARRKHERAEEEGRTCIECHKGLVHEEPDAPEETTAALD